MSDTQSTPPSGTGGIVVPIMTGMANGAYRPPPPLPDEPDATTMHDQWTSTVIRELDARFRKLDKKVWLAVVLGASQLAVMVYELLRGLR